jgi:hypothetical protein
VGLCFVFVQSVLLFVVCRPSPPARSPKEWSQAPSYNPSAAGGGSFLQFAAAAMNMQRQGRHCSSLFY